MPEDTLPTLDAALDSAWPSSDAAESPKAEKTPEAPAPDAPAPDAPADDASDDTEKPEKAAADDAAGDEKPDAPVVDEAPLNLPAHWPAQVKANFEKLHKADPEAAKFMLEQQDYLVRQWSANKDRIKPYEKLADSLDDVLREGREARSMNGMDDAGYLRSLVSAEQVIAKNPVAGIKWLAEQYGVDLGSFGQASEGQPDINSHPAVQQLRQELAELKSGLTATQQREQQQQFSQLTSTIQSFADEKGSNGQPLRPYFDEVLLDIQIVVQRQIANGQSPDLNSAYETAIRMNDAVWQRVQAAKTAAATKASAEKRAKEALEAKRAGFSLSGSNGGASAEPPKTIDEAISRAMSSVT